MLILAGLAVGFLAAIIGNGLVAEGESQPPATAPAGDEAASQPAEGAYPSRKLLDACDTAAEKLKKRLDGTFHVVVSPPFVIAGNFAERNVRAYADRTVVAAAYAMWASLFDRKPTDAITILLLKDDKTYRAWAKSLFDDEEVAHYGYFRPWDRTMVMNISTGGGTLVHELTHALIVYDFPDVPTWLNEGLGSLHEQCGIKDDRIVGHVNWRLPGLRKAIAAGTLRPLKELVTKRDFRGRLRGLNYAQARYFVMYMQEKGVLLKFYRHFREHHDGDGADVNAIETIFGRDIDDVDKLFVAWVKTLRFRR